MEAEKFGIFKIFGRIFCIFLLATLTVLSIITSSEAGNDQTVALVMKALSNPFFFKMKAGAQEYAQEENIPLEVFGVERETDVDRQIGIFENLISRGYGAIVIAPADSKKLVAVCKKALDKNIVVINIDNPLHRESMDQLGIDIPFVGSDNRLGAQMIGNYVKNKLNGLGQVILIEGIRGVENADLRKKGFIEAVTQNSNIKIVSSESANWHTDETFSLANRLLQKYKSIDAIFCANDKMALGVLQALDIMDLTGSILLAGYDNIESVRDEMRNSRIQATVEQHPELMGEYGVELAWKALNRHKIPSYKQTPLDLITYECFNKKVALSISSLKNPFFSTLLDGVREAAELFGIKLVIANAENKDAQQLRDIANLIKQKVDVIIINPTHTETITPGIEMANSYNIPVITVDRKASAGKILCHIESNNVEGGRMAAKLLVEYLKGEGKVIEIEGIPGTSAAHERGMGFNEVLRRYPAIKVVSREVANFDRNEARDIMRQLLRKDIQFDAVFAHNDNMILGAIEAFKELNIQLPRVLIGFDAIREALQEVKQGSLTATIAQKPETMGRLSIELITDYFRGEELPTVIPVELSLVIKKGDVTLLRSVNSRFYAIAGVLVLIFVIGYAILAFFLRQQSQSAIVMQETVFTEREIRFLYDLFNEIRFWERSILFQDHSEADKKFGAAMVQMRKLLTELHNKPLSISIREKLAQGLYSLTHYEEDFNKIIQLKTEQRLNFTRMDTGYRSLASFVLRSNRTDLLKPLFNLTHFLLSYRIDRLESEYQALQVVMNSFENRLFKAELMDDRVKGYVKSYKGLLDNDFALEQQIRSIDGHFDEIGTQLMALILEISKESEILLRNKFQEIETSRARLNRLFLISTVISIITLLLILTIISKKIINPIRSVAGVMRDVKAGNIEARSRILGNKNDEIVQFCLSFNDMLDTLEKNNQQLVEYQNELEERVLELAFRKKELENHRNHLEDLIEDRTSELTMAVNQLQDEIQQRQVIELELEKHREDLESIIKERTADLSKTNQELEKEIAGRKKAERERQRLTIQLQRAEKMEAIGTLAGGVAHDLNNILSGIVSYPELLLLQLSEDSPLREPILTSVHPR